MTCSNTRAWAYYHGVPEEDPRWIAEAERRYAEIMAGKPPSRGALRTTCTLGHLLREPNLRAKKPGKSCRACGNTQVWARYHKIPKTDPRWIAEADRRYAEIMSAS